MIGIIGSTGSGKTSFALHYASTFGREGLYVITNRTIVPEALPEVSLMSWKTVETDHLLPSMLHRINNGSNLFRADRRVLVIDSLSSYFISWHEALLEEQGECDSSAYAEHVATARLALEEAILSFQGKLFLITNEAPLITPFMSKQEQSFARELAKLNAVVLRRCDQLFRMTAGIPQELTSLRFRG
ncbi:bifunctional adenosylcobinamide kinase/adenosylcobinamide-phosphate guanylyltransferase [Paenibacillus sp. 481]|uniref:bifunctional adenosylcobinamide kinase/adenosylcobinamide-phosphate guanylyltransferase n=1 Tax=Paenibacillus sp. 481 TaxID=2835869 RepID=UPI001E58ADDE|nr:bifunctional adenosylcobinamide kinase/adenosylcobinamide-phosphate guanylyltransferase [Paenibacillus sp. 481]